MKGLNVPAPREIFAIVVVGVIFAILSTVISSHGSQHADALMDAEPSINMKLGRGPVSYTHPQAIPGSRLALLTPLYTYGLAAWLSVWGISSPAVISMNCVIVACAALLVWVFVAYGGFIRSVRLRVAMTLLLPLVSSVAVVYRINRYDSLGMLGLAVACASLALKKRWQRLPLLVAGGILTGTAGFHVVMASALLALVALVFIGWSRIPEFIAFGFAVALGLGIALALVINSGTLDILKSSLEQNAAHVRRPWHWYLLAPLRGGQKSGLLDADLLLAFCSVLMLWATASAPRRGSALRAASFGAVVGVGIPLLLSCAGRYSNTYVWLAAAPMFVCCFIALDQGITAPWRRLGIATLLAIVALVGLPAHALMAAAEWQARDRAPVEAFIAGAIEPSDVVYTTFVGYYPVKKKATTAYFGSAFKSMTDDQRAAVNVMVIGSKETGEAMFEPTAAEAKASFGGHWDEVGRLQIPRGEFRSRIPPRPKSEFLYDVTVYRRRTESAPK